MPSNVNATMRRIARHLWPDLFSGYRWWRKLIGGRWERWYIDCVHDEMWILVPSTANDDYRPPLGRGMPTREIWP